MTRDELYESDRGERQYYESKRSIKERIKLPLTKDGIEALLEMVTKSLEIPLDETIRQVFTGYVHHTDQLENSTSFGDIGKLLFNHLSKHATWKLDQESKERMKKKEADRLAALEKEKPDLTLAKDTADESKGADAVQ